ncbi:MAG: hypothetical protein AAGK67_14920 [Pseudomonadota bacterium]
MSFEKVLSLIILGLGAIWLIAYNAVEIFAANDVIPYEAFLSLETWYEEEIREENYWLFLIAGIAFMASFFYWLYVLMKRVGR